MQAHTMILSLEEIENFLIYKKLIRRDEIEELKEQKHFGRSNCKALGRFMRTVKEDFRQMPVFTNLRFHILFKYIDSNL